ncbi:hypothetical protein [Rickettsia conorii]|nr:hypothetical protein [Rickettsia conorii]
MGIVGNSGSGKSTLIAL